MALTPADLDRIEELAKAAAPGKATAVSHHPGALLFAALDRATVLSLVDLARQAPRWIPVEERLPDIDGEPVLVWLNNAPALARRTHCEWLVGREPFPFNAVTHWMGLPETPEPIALAGEPAPREPVFGRKRR